jgi:hypothetical protein
MSAGRDARLHFSSDSCARALGIANARPLKNSSALLQSMNFSLATWSDCFRKPSHNAPTCEWLRDSSQVGVSVHTWSRRLNLTFL